MAKEFDADARENGNCGYISEDLDQPCRHGEGWGYPEATSGFCSEHGDRGGQVGNSNAEGNDGGDGAEVTHGVYAKPNKMYTEEFDDTLREHADLMFSDFVRHYRDRFGDVPYWIKQGFSEIAINSAKRIFADNWSTDKPDELKTTSPLVDKETEIVPVGDGEIETQIKYTETVPSGAQQRFRREDRQWLSKIGMFEHEPGQQKADGLSTLAEVLSEK